MATSTNVIELLQRDHKKVEALFARLDALPLEELEDYFCNLREELVRHEVAEELIVYPAFRASVPGGDRIADARIAEQSEAEEELKHLEELETRSPAFKSRLEQLRHAVLEHAEHEEHDVFPPMQSNIDTKELGELGERYERALKAAPTHPHPHAPDTPPGNKVLGPVAALVDKMRDAMRAA